MRKLILLVSLLLIPRSLLATTYYVDSSCTNNGTGTTDACASSNGAAGAFNGATSTVYTTTPNTGLQQAFILATAGDTILIKNGTYTCGTTTNTCNGNINRLDGGFHLVNNGTAGNPITIKNYPGHSPVLQNCSNGTTVWCDHPTITIGLSGGYYVIEGLTIKGAIFGISGNGGAQGETCGATHAVCYDGIIIHSNDISTGWSTQGDGNWSGLWLQGCINAHVYNNNIHDIVLPSDGTVTLANGTDGIKYYGCVNNITEYNTIKDVLVYESGGGGIGDKVWMQGSIYRYNIFENVPSCLSMNNYSFGTHVTGTVIYQNICTTSSHAQVGSDARHDCVYTGETTSYSLYNNVFWGCGVGFWFPGGGGEGDVFLTQYNNIISINTSENISTIYNLAYVDQGGPASTYTANYNAWTSPHVTNSFDVAGTVHNLFSAFQTAVSPQESASAEVDCLFTSPAYSGGDFTLQSSSTCKAGQAHGGKVGGVSGGANIDLGPYVNGITCIGYNCGAAPSSGVMSGRKTKKFVSTIGGLYIAMMGLILFGRA